MRYETEKLELAKKVIKPSDVYEAFGPWPVTRETALRAMTGFKVVAFRPVQQHETFLSKAGIVKAGWRPFEPSWAEYDGGPRFILEPIPFAADPSVWE